MKRKGYRLLTVLLAMVMFVMVGVRAQAASGDAVTKDGVTAQLITDKDAYTLEDTINAMIRINNNTGSEVTVEATVNLSEGALFNADSKSQEAVLKAGGQWTTQNVITFEAAALADGSALASGGAFGSAIWMIAIVLVAAILAVLFVFTKKNKTKAAMLFLSLTMAGVLAVGVIPAEAASGKGKLSLSCKVLVDDVEKEITATVNYTIKDDGKDQADNVSAEPTLEFIPLFETDFSNDEVGSGPSKGVDGWTIITGDAVANAFVHVKSEGDNKYLQLYVAEGGRTFDARTSKNISLMGKDNFQIQFKVKTGNETARLTLLSAAESAITIWEGQYSDWTDIKLVFDLTDTSNVKRTTYVNGEMTEEAKPIAFLSDLTLDALGFRGKEGGISPGGTLCFDDIKVGHEMWVSEDFILAPNNVVNWENVVPTNALSENSYVNNMKFHPRILVSSWEEVLEKIDGSSSAAAWYRAAKREADTYVNNSAPKYTSAAESGTDINFFRQCRDHLELLAFVYNIEKLKGNELAHYYLNAAYDQMVLMGNYPEWDDFSHYLSTAEITYGFACAYDWLYYDLTPEQRETIIEIVKDKSLRDLVHNYEGVITGNTFHVSTNNWNPMCNGAAIGAAFAFGNEEPKLCEYIMERAPLYVRYSLEPYAPLGANEEGVSYWDYGTLNLVCIMDTLNNGFVEGFELPEDYHYEDAVGIADTCDFPIYFTGPVMSFNYGDCNPGMSYSSLYFWMANNYSKPEYAWYNQYILSEYKNATLTGNELLEAICWFDPENVETKDFKLDKFYDEGADKKAFNGISMRSDWEKDALYAAMQGGYNGANHMHLSLGTYVIDYHGKRFVRVIGEHDYSIGGADRDTYYKRAEAYNCVVINPSIEEDQLTNGYAEVIKSGTSDNTAFGIMDMSKAYYPGHGINVESAKRGLMLTDNRNRVVVQDEITVDTESEFYWYANTDADIKISRDKKSAILNNGGERMLARIIKGPEGAEFEIVEAKSTVESVNNVIRLDQKLAIHVTGLKTFELAVEYIGLSEGEGVPAENEFVPLDEWTADDKDELADAEWDVTVQLDGKNMKFFDIKRSQYAFDFNADVQKPYEVTIKNAKKAEATVVPATTIGKFGVEAADANKDGVPDDTARITVVVGDKTYTYDIKMQRNMFEGIITKSDPGILNSLSIAMEGNDLPSENSYIYVESLQSCCGWDDYPERGIVDDIITHSTSDESKINRWACDCPNSWIMVDFGKSYNLHSAAFAGVLQNRRQYKFDVLVSADGENWTTVHTDGAPVTVDYMSILPFADNATDDSVKNALKNVRYVKFEGSKYLDTATGTDGPWDNYAEIRFYESAEKEQTDIAFWPAFFSSTGMVGFNLFSGKIGETKPLDLKGIDYYNDKFDFGPDAKYEFVFSDDSVARIDMVDGVPNITFVRSGNTNLKVTVTEKGFSASAEASVMCTGILEGANISKITFLDKDGEAISKLEMEILSGTQISLPAGDGLGSVVDTEKMEIAIFNGWTKVENGKAVGSTLTSDDKVTIDEDMTFQGVYDRGSVILYKDGTEAEEINYSGKDTSLSSVDDPIDKASNNKVYQIATQQGGELIGYLTQELDSSPNTIIIEGRFSTAADGTKDRIKGFISLGKHTETMWIGSTASTWKSVRVVMEKKGSNWITNAYLLDSNTNEYVLDADNANKTFPISNTTLFIGGQVRTSKSVFMDDLVIYTFD